MCSTSAGLPTRLPMVEWAPWWDQTTARWEQEGLSGGMDLETSQRHFGLDPLLIITAGGRARTCPRNPHGAPSSPTERPMMRFFRYLYTDEIIEDALKAARELKAKHDRGEVILRL